MRVQGLLVFLILALENFYSLSEAALAEAGAASEGKLQSGALRSEFCYFVMRKVVGMRKEEAEVFVAKGMDLGLGDGRSVWRRVAGC